MSINAVCILWILMYGFTNLQMNVISASRRARNQEPAELDEQDRWAPGFQPCLGLDMGCRAVEKLLRSRIWGTPDESYRIYRFQGTNLWRRSRQIGASTKLWLLFCSICGDRESQRFFFYLRMGLSEEYAVTLPAFFGRWLTWSCGQNSFSSMLSCMYMCIYLICYTCVFKNMYKCI